MFDVLQIRKDFPLLEQRINGKPVVYLDNAATSLKPEQVINAELNYYRNIGASIHRGIYSLSEQATHLYEQTRKKTAQFINAKEESEIVFTPQGTTFAINLVMQSWGLANLKAGDEIVLTEMEHHANLIPWQILSQRTGAELKFIPLRQDSFDGTVDLSEVDKVITEKTKLVAFSGMSNVTGVINPAKEIIDIAHKKGALVLLDGAQSVSHIPTDVQDLDCDFLVFSGHKMCGPTGVGILYGKKHILNDMDPFITGGSMIVQVWKDKATYRDVPERFEAGTPNIAGVIGFGAALDYLNMIGMRTIHEREKELLAYALGKLRGRKNLTLYGTADTDRRGGILSFRLGDIHPHDTGEVMAAEGIAIRVGHHCCQPLMKTWCIPGTSRASFYFYNTFEEIDMFIKAMDRVEEVFA